MAGQAGSPKDVIVEVDGRETMLSALEYEPYFAALGAAAVAEQAGLRDFVTADRGRFAVFTDGRPEWLMQGVSGDLPEGVPLFDLLDVGGVRGVLEKRDRSRYAVVGIEALGISPVLVPSRPELLSALGRVVAPPIAHASKGVLEMGELLDDSRLPGEYGYLSGLTSDRIPTHLSTLTQALATVRVAGEGDALTVPVSAPMVENIEASFLNACRLRGRAVAAGGTLEIVTLHVRRTGRRPAVRGVEALGYSWRTWT
jgi:hypothetical protein